MTPDPSGAAGPAPTLTAWGAPIPQAPIDRSNDVELSRTWWTAKAQCLTESGFPAHYDGEGIEITGGGPDQRDALSAQSQACHEEVTDRLGPLPSEIPYSTAELRAEYALLVETARCLQEHGYPPASDPPSEQAYVANQQQIYAGNEKGLDNRWTPYPDDPNAHLAARELCPHPTGPEITAWLAQHSGR